MRKYKIYKKNNFYGKMEIKILGFSMWIQIRDFHLIPKYVKRIKQTFLSLTPWLLLPFLLIFLPEYIKITMIIYVLLFFVNGIQLLVASTIDRKVLIESTLEYYKEIIRDLKKIELDKIEVVTKVVAEYDETGTILEGKNLQRKKKLKNIVDEKE